MLRSLFPCLQTRMTRLRAFLPSTSANHVLTGKRSLYSGFAPRSARSYPLLTSGCRLLAVSESKLKRAAVGVGGYAIGLIVICVVLFLVVLLLRGMVWASDKMMPWLVTASGIALLVCIFIFLPLCIFRKTRPWAGVGYVYASYVFGLMLWAYSCLFVVYAWGYGALAVGLIFAGVGVVPVALLAAIFHAEWAVLLEVVVGIVLTFGTRFLGLWLTTPKQETEEEGLVDY
jgi:hypothetical protein